MNPWRDFRRRVARVPGIGLTMVLPNTASFVARSWLRSRAVPMYPDIPAPRVGLGMTAQVALDETVLGVMRSPRRHPHRQDYIRVGAELREALEMYQAHGWIDDPRRYHAPPPVLDRVEGVSGSSRGTAYERIKWESGYEPHPGEPGGDRWMAHEANRSAYAVLVRAEPPSANWLVCIHGFGMGVPLTDFHAFRVRRIVSELRCNLAFPVLPMHGPRRTAFLSGADFMTYDLMNPVFGLTQAVWDGRALVGWLKRVEGARRIGFYGISLGGYAGSLLAGIEDSFDLGIAGIPASDFPQLFRHHSPSPLRRRALEYGMLGEVPARVHRVVSPLAVEPFVPKDRRFVYGALGDRMSTPQQTLQLWNHWGRPRIEWLHAGHVGAVMAPAAEAFVMRALVDSGFSGDSPLLLAG